MKRFEIILLLDTIDVSTAYYALNAYAAGDYNKWKDLNIREQDLRTSNVQIYNFALPVKNMWRALISTQSFLVKKVVCKVSKMPRQK